MNEALILSKLGTIDGETVIEFCKLNGIQDIEFVGERGFKFAMPTGMDSKQLQKNFSTLSKVGRTFPVRFDQGLAYIDYNEFSQKEFSPVRPSSSPVNHSTERKIQKARYDRSMSHISAFSSDLNLDDILIPIFDGMGLYFGAHFRSQSKKNDSRILPPIEQLTPKGMALLFAIFADKNGSKAQPLVATRFEDIVHVVKLMKDAPEGTRIPIIFQEIDSGETKRPYEQDYTNHKTTIFLCKHQGEIHAIFLDSIGKEQYYCKKISEKTKIHPHVPNQKSYRSRQLDSYQCGVFAIKDARTLNNDPAIINNILAADEREYNFPTKVFKLSDEPDRMDSIPNKDKDVIVNRSQMTLSGVYHKYDSVENGYVSHFSEKYRAQVTKYYNTHQPNDVVARINEYDASKLTSQKLLNNYSPSPRTGISNQSSEDPNNAGTGRESKKGGNCSIS